MSPRILVPHDGSEQAGAALEHAVTAFPAGDIHLLSVIEPATTIGDPATYTATHYDQQKESAEATLEEASAAIGDDSRFETATAIGRPVHEILQYVDHHGIDHVVMGTHGREGVSRILLGSVAETVVRRAPVPVTVVRGDPDTLGSSDSVLVPFDSSTPARRALEYAIEQFGAESVTALYVMYPASDTITGTPGFGATSAELESWEDEKESHAQQILDIADEVAADAGGAVDTEAVRGRPADAIVEYLDAHEMDHVVIGSTGRDGLARILLGSVAETVIRRSPASVTVAR